MIGGILEKTWRGFTSSYDAAEVLGGSTPRATVLAVFSLSTCVLAVAYLPAFEASHFESPWVSVVFALLGGVTTAVAFRHGCTGRWGSLATLLDNAFYVAALAWAAAHTTQVYGLFFSACLAAMLLGFQATTYGISVPMVAAFTLPPALIACWSKPDTLVMLALFGTVLLAIVRLTFTTDQRLRSRPLSNWAEPLLRGESGKRYRLGPLLGRGGMGVVHRAETERGEQLAVKVLRTLGSDDARSKRLLREALTVNSVQHPGVVPVIDYGMPDDGPPFLVMELLEGRTLADAVRAVRGGLPWPEAVRAILPVLAALEAAHRREIVHCDVKPSNVFLCRNGQVKLLDFGIARYSENVLDLTLSLNVAGTPTCMAKEQLLNPDGVSARTDVWGAGACLFHALSGAWPREVSEPCRSIDEAVRIPARPIESLKPELPAALVRAVNVALADDPALRWASAWEFEQQLRACLGEPASAA